jgi:hypothetical protein
MIQTIGVGPANATVGAAGRQTEYPHLTCSSLSENSTVDIGGVQVEYRSPRRLGVLPKSPKSRYGWVREPQP